MLPPFVTELAQAAGSGETLVKAKAKRRRKLEI